MSATIWSASRTAVTRMAWIALTVTSWVLIQNSHSPSPDNTCTCAGPCSRGGCRIATVKPFRRRTMGTLSVTEAIGFSTRRRDGETDGKVRLADTGRTEEDDVFLAFDEAERVEAVDLLAFDTRLK